MLWELTIDKRSLEELAEMVTALSGYRPDNSGAITLQTPEKLLNTWERLQAEHSINFTVSTDDFIHWHLREALASETAKQWKAAVFHWNHLVQAEPDNQSYQGHLIHARDLLNTTNALPRP